MSDPDVAPRSYTDPNAARDLGFGFRVADDSRVRLLNRDGSFNVVRRGTKGRTIIAPYHMLLTIGWRKLFALIFLCYFSANTLFALGYLACGHDALVGPGFSGVPPMWSGVLRAFFFSVETFGTVGYGHIVPAGIAANVLVTCESLIGLLSLGVLAGIVFARFSRPTAQVLYSNRALIAPYRGISAFMFRCANRRNNQLIDVSVKILYSELKHRPSGERVRSFTILPLEFEKVTFFTLSWTVVHPIDETSPLYGYTESDLADRDVEFLILMSGTDETFSQQVYSRTSYKPHEVVWGARFKPMFVEAGNIGVVGMDLSQIHEFELIVEQGVGQ